MRSDSKEVINNHLKETQIVGTIKIKVQEDKEAKPKTFKGAHSNAFIAKSRTIIKGIAKRD